MFATVESICVTSVEYTGVHLEYIWSTFHPPYVFAVEYAEYVIFKNVYSLYTIVYINVGIHTSMRI
eukprot:SAG25_NODE_1497_length_2899_cov_1.736786_1_plen_65_part_10